MILVLTMSAFAAAPGYQQPPDAIGAILDASSPPAVSVSPNRTWMLELERPNLRPLAELAEPSVKVAGIQINPETNGPAREYASRGIELRDMASAKRAQRIRIDLPVGARVGQCTWQCTGLSRLEISSDLQLHSSSWSSTLSGTAQ